MPGISTFSKATADLICQRLGDGESLRRICKDESLPCIDTVMKWLGDFPEFSAQYARARELQADTMFEMVAEIAHDGAADWTMTKFGPVVDQEHISRSRLRVDTLKWQASKLAPKKYGDRLDLNHGGEIGLNVLAERMSKARARK